MDQTALDIRRREAGAQYLSALRSLGLEPNGLFWAYDEATKQFALFLVTDLFDIKGPYEISKLLFKAYNRAGTPREIDPFIVRLHSPNHRIISELMIGLGGGRVQRADKNTGAPHGNEISITGAKFDDIQVYADWVYRRPSLRPRLKPVDAIAASRKWDKFARAVDRLAA